MISAPKLSLIWSSAMAAMGIMFWLYAALTLAMPAFFAPLGFILAILAGLFVLVLAATGALAGTANLARAWDEGAEYDSNRAYKFGFTTAWTVYLVAWLFLEQGWVSVDAAFPMMGAVTGGSYCMFMGVVGLRGWYETRHASD